MDRMCPVMGEIIEDIVCFDICMVSEGLAPERTAPKRAIEKPDMKEICLKCKYHED